MTSLRNRNMYYSCEFFNIQGQRDFYYLHFIIRLLFLFNSRSETRGGKKKHDRQGKLPYLSKQMTWKQPTYRTGNIKACPNLNFQNCIA